MSIAPSNLDLTSGEGVTSLRELLLLSHRCRVILLSPSFPESIRTDKKGTLISYEARSIAFAHAQQSHTEEEEILRRKTWTYIHDLCPALPLLH